MAYQYSDPHKSEFDFTNVFRDNVTCPSAETIPKIAHFVHSDVKELTWLDYAAIRGAIVNLGVGKVNIWLPENAQLKGWIWNRVIETPEVKLRRIAMPSTVFGADVANFERQADIVRLKILYEEGGISLDNDLVALKSSDDVILNSTTRSSVMAMQQRGDGMPNGFIMSKRGSPFLRRWIEQYRECPQKDIWDQLSTSTPHTMYMDRDPDLTVLDGHSWFYPLSAERDGDTSLKMLWFGKSWHDIDISHGTHFWHPTEKFSKMIMPHTIQNIDTPLFCKMRKLFDNLDEDGYYAELPEKNPNCSVTWTSDLQDKDHRIFSDYKIITDDLDNKWIDSSGFNHHGWAPMGTRLHNNNTAGIPVREIAPGSYAVLPVPVDWDARVWTFRMRFQMDSRRIMEGEGVGLFMIRMENGGEILIRIRNINPWPGLTLILEWHGDKLAKQEYRTLDNKVWVSHAGLSALKSGAHELAMTLDRKNSGAVKLFLDGTMLTNDTLPLVASPKIGQEIWFNAQHWDDLDTGFRGTLNRFTIYADALSAEEVATPIAGSATYSKIVDTEVESVLPHNASSNWALLFPSLLVMLVLIFMLRRKKALFMAIPEYAKQAPDFAKTVPNLLMDFAKNPSSPRSPTSSP